MHNCNNTSCCNCSQKDQYEEFIPYQEYPIGELFEIKNKVFKVVVENVVKYGCTNCDFSGTLHCEPFECNGFMREDSEDVIAILYDTLEENE